MGYEEYLLIEFDVILFKKTLNEDMFNNKQQASVELSSIGERG
jgi:hypothetical protein